MKIRRFCSGLGNEMFQYATFLQIKKIYPNEDIYVDAFSWYKWSKLEFELDKVFDISLPMVESFISDEQFNIINNELDKLKTFEACGFDSHKTVPPDFVEVIAALSFIEIPICYLKADIELKNVSEPKLQLKMSDVKRKYEEKMIAGSKENAAKKLQNTNIYLFCLVRLITNRYVRKRFINNILKLKKPDFCGFRGLDVLKSEGDTYYNIYGNPNDCAGVEEQLLKDFSFKPFEDEENIKMLIQIENTNSISIHARVRDFNYGMKSAINNKYFVKAVKHIKKRVADPVFFVFSDDVTWCEKNWNILGLDKSDKIIYVDINKGKNSYRDMQLMSYCKHNIIPNSTFSWWASFLNKNPNKIVCTPYATFPGTISF